MNEQAKRLLEKLSGLESIEGLGDGEALERIGTLIGLSGDFGPSLGTERALALSEALSKRGLQGKQAVLLHSFRANAFANRRHERGLEREAFLNWEQPQPRADIRELRFRTWQSQIHASGPT